MFLSIDPSRGVPIYRQIMEQIKQSIASGALRAGDRLPSVRQLSLDLEVNPTTVVKAYSELDHAGVVCTRRGTGTFVGEGGVEIGRARKQEILGRLADRLLVEARQLRVGADEVRRLVEERIERYYPERPGDSRATGSGRRQP